MGSGVFMVRGLRTYKRNIMLYSIFMKPAVKYWQMGTLKEVY